MKRLNIILLFSIALASCQKDFNELTDSNQRQITFTFELSHLFDEVLVEHSGTYSLGSNYNLDGNHLLRVTSYCYDSSDSLLQSHTLLCTDLIAANQSFRHLDKNISYHFVFVADVVKSDPDVDYYETWYQMDTRNYQRFYFFSDSRSKQAEYDVMQFASLIAQPENQSLNISFEPMTYNGYFLLTNANKSDRITGFAGYVNAFQMSSKSWQRRTSLAYEFTHYRPSAQTLTQPLNFCYADSVVYVKVRSTTLTGTDSVIVNVPNVERRPFVLTIDCESMQMTDCKFY